MPGDKNEIPSVELFDRHYKVVNALWKGSRATSVEAGWHYLLDLTLIAEKSGMPMLHLHEAAETLIQQKLLETTLGESNSYVPSH